VRRLETGVEEQAVTLPMSQAELASVLGLSRPNVNLRLRRLQAQGLVELRRGQIRVLDADRLRAAATGAATRT
jgi:CRP-like cAMP-binding protein